MAAASERFVPSVEVWLSAESLMRLEPVLRAARKLTRTELWWLLSTLQAMMSEEK